MKDRCCGTCRMGSVCGTLRFFVDLCGLMNGSRGVLIDNIKNAGKAFEQLGKFGKYCMAYERIKKGEVVEIR